MKFNSKIIESLETALKGKLPGEDAQYRMAPSYRPRLTREQIMLNNPKIGGVMLLLYVKEGELYIVLTKRREYNGVHSAQMSFPGGKSESGDESIKQTALRETREEIGVTAEKIKVLGQLSELYIPPSNFLIYPTVGFAKEIGEFHAQQEEVQKIVEIPVDFFLDQRNINLQTEISLPGGNKVRVPAYVYNEYIIWGATAIILSEFTLVMEKILTGLMT
jgi:8-oxo-dGTP pyrophosphatase MutT (NUDIX family)